MTQHDFQERYAERTGLSWGQLEEYLQVVPCKCGKRSCPGWQMITLPTRLPPLRVDCGTGVQPAPRTLDEDFRRQRNLFGAQV
jgi:hypothetical protein